MMNQKTWTVRILFALRVVILVKILLLTAPVFGQGRLSGIRNEVRKNESKPKPSSNNNRKRPSSSDRHDHGDNDHDDGSHHNHNHDRRDRDRGRNNHRYRRPRVNFFSCPTPPPQVIHTHEVHVIEPAPVFIPAPVVAQPQLVPSATMPLTESIPVSPTIPVSPLPNPPANQAVLEGPYQSVVEPTPAISHSAVIVDDSVFQSDFTGWGARITAWYGGGVDDISQGNLGFLFQAPGSLGLDGNVRTIREKGFTDHLWLGDLNLVYEPVLTNDFRLRIGAGFNWLSDDWGSDFGFNLTSGFDACLTDRWVLGGEVDLGNLGSADYLHAQLSLAYQLENAELVFGYDHTNIGSIDMNSPFVGLRFRF